MWEGISMLENESDIVVGNLVTDAPSLHTLPMPPIINHPPTQSSNVVTTQHPATQGQSSGIIPLIAIGLIAWMVFGGKGRG